MQRDGLQYNNSGVLQHPTLSIRSSRQKKSANKETLDLNSPLDQMGLTLTQNILSNNCRVHVLLLSTQNILQDRPYFRPKKRSLNKFKISIFSGHNGTILEDNAKKNFENYTYI